MTRTNGKKEGLSAREYIHALQKESGKKLSEIFAEVSSASGVSRRTLQVHVEYNVPVSTKTAKKLQDWSDGKISAAKTLGVA